MNTMTHALAQRPLGRTGPQVSAVGFGCMGLVGWYGSRNDEESRATLLEAVDRGVNHFDTAASYQVGENERFVGEILRPVRSRILLASKCGLSRSASGAALVDNRPETIRASLDASLSRLGFDTIDLFYLHRIDKTVPIEESVGALAELVRSGKIRFIGLSECSATTLRRAAKVHPIAAVQTEYSIWSRDPEQSILAACREVGASFVAYSPLGRGFLAGNFRRVAELPAGDNRASHPRFQDANAAHNETLVALLRDIASEHGSAATTAQIAIAWVLSRAPEVVTIPGMKTRAHLRDNLAGGELQLTAAQLQRIDTLLEQSPTAGERHPPSMMQAIDRDD
ncbi:MAG: aldo/keto reductase [Nevskiaceae bacterium]|jgi:aryl-alcohol dehydrogenase-like predicted oxidoreductase|nr:aldo/keto reductase [Nevskiaceae bacterium]